MTNPLDQRFNEKFVGMGKSYTYLHDFDVIKQFIEKERASTISLVLKDLRKWLLHENTSEHISSIYDFIEKYEKKGDKK